MHKASWICFFLSSWMWGVIHSDQILISSFGQSLQINIPTQSNIQSQQIQPTTLRIILDEKIQGNTIKQALMLPFRSIEIYPSGEQTFIDLHSQQSAISFTQTQSQNRLMLTFEVHPEFQWWGYILVVLMLLGMIGFLIYLKRKQSRYASTSFQIKQQYFNKNCIIITIESEEMSYLIFSNHKESILLDRIKRKGAKLGEET